MKRIVSTWSDRFPRDSVANVKLRLKLLDRCKTDKDLRAGVIHACTLDPIFFVSMFVIQANPKALDHKVGPFIPRDYQVEGIKNIIRDVFMEGEDHGIEKSREEGASWAAIFIFLWACLFHYSQHCCAISHTEKAVDNGPMDSKSLFWKARFILNRLPDWMTRGYQKAKLSFEFPATESSFIGEASTGRSAVGGRGPCLLDEVGQMTKAEEIISNTADVGPRLVISTHYRTRDGQAFARFIDRRGLRKSLWHWSMNPDKSKGMYKVPIKDADPIKLDPKFNYDLYPFVTTGKPGGPFAGIRSVWYDKECVRRNNARDVAMHLDIDREGSSSQFFDIGIITNLAHTFGQNPEWEGVVDFDKHTGKLIGLRRRAGGHLRLFGKGRIPDLYGRVRPGRYVIGADVSDGQSLTPSCLCVIDTQSCEVIAEFSDSSTGGSDFSPIATAVGYLFSSPDGTPALISWETNGPGGKFGKKMMGDLKYPNLSLRVIETHDDSVPIYTQKVGWHSNPSSKLLLLEDLREAVESQRLLIRSLALLEELKCFHFSKATDKIEHSGDVGATDGSEMGANHADLAMACGIAWMLCIRTSSGIRQIEQAKEIPVGSRLWRDNLHRAKELETNSTWHEG